MVIEFTNLCCKSKDKYQELEEDLDDDADADLDW